MNYLAEMGQNTIYMMTLTAGGDGQDVWPWAATDLAKIGKHTENLDPDITSVYDVSKLGQWEILFDHMDAKGIYKNIFLQEHENDQLLNGGTDVDGSSLSVERHDLYARDGRPVRAQQRHPVEPGRGELQHHPSARTCRTG